MVAVQSSMNFREYSRYPLETSSRIIHLAYTIGILLNIFLWHFFSYCICGTFPHTDFFGPFVVMYQYLTVSIYPCTAIYCCYVYRVQVTDYRGGNDKTPNNLAFFQHSDITWCIAPQVLVKINLIVTTWFVYIISNLHGACIMSYQPLIQLPGIPSYVSVMGSLNHMLMRYRKPNELLNRRESASRQDTSTKLSVTLPLSQKNQGRSLPPLEQEEMAKQTKEEGSCQCHGQEKIRYWYSGVYRNRKQLYLISVLQAVDIIEDNIQSVCQGTDEQKWVHKDVRICMYDFLLFWLHTWYRGISRWTKLSSRGGKAAGWWLDPTMSQ